MKTPLLVLLAVDLCSAASTLLKGGTIIAFDEATDSLQVIRDGSLLITGDTITRIFESGEEPPSNSTSRDDGDLEVLDVTGKIITPGFIDTHRHGWQTSFKTLASNVTLWTYLNRFSEFASEGLFTADDVYVSQLTGLYEALNAGVTTSLDHAHHTWSEETSAAGLSASIDSGARVFWAYAFHFLANFTTAEQRANFRAIAAEGSFKGTRTSLGIACDYFGPVPVEEEVKAVVDLALEYNVPVLTTHTLDGPFGLTNGPEDLHRAGILNTSIPVVFSHASLITYRGAQLLRATDQYISITPESEMHYGQTHPHNHLFPVHTQASLGVDTHMTFSTDILTQARIWLQSVRYKLFDDALSRWRAPATNPMSVNQAFLLATRNGALALRRPDLGIIAEGATADLVVWDGESPSLLGWRDPVAAVILHASVADIEHVLVGGDFVKRDGKITAPGYGDLKKRFLKSTQRIQETFITQRPTREPEPGELFYEGGAELVDVAQVDVTRGEGNGYGQEFL